MKFKPGTTVVVHTYNDPNRAWLGTVTETVSSRGVMVKNCQGVKYWTHYEWLSKPKFKND